MIIDIQAGKLFINENINLYPGLKRPELLAKPDIFEIWIEYENMPVSYRAIFRNPLRNSEEIILIVYMGLENSPIQRWYLFLSGGVDGTQKRPEGKYTRLMREWFLKNFKQHLPIDQPWGYVDASHDPHNQTTAIVCNYQKYNQKR